MKKNVSGYIFFIALIVFLVLISYKISCWKLSFVYGIEKPTFWQVIMSGK